MILGAWSRQHLNIGEGVFKTESEVFMFYSLLTASTTPSTGINLDVADAIVDLTTKVLELFTVFPLNVFLGAALVGVGIGVYRGLKRS